MPRKRDQPTRDTISRPEFVTAVREHMNAQLAHSTHHPGAGYTPTAFRHYIRRQALLGCLQSLKFDSALDVGCAEGYFMESVAERFSIPVWGVDISDECVARVHKHLGFQVAAADATRLPLPDDSIDLVYSTEVIEHILDPDRMIDEMTRVARRWVVVTTPVSQTAHEHEPDFQLADEGHVNDFDRKTVEDLFGSDAQLGSFRCNATLALIVAVGRYLPPILRERFYKLDHWFSQRFGNPTHRFKPLRNRDWLIVVPTSSGKPVDPEWRCPEDRGRVVLATDRLRCETCGCLYRVSHGVPDFALGGT